MNQDHGHRFRITDTKNYIAAQVLITSYICSRSSLDDHDNYNNVRCYVGRYNVGVGV